MRGVRKHGWGAVLAVLMAGCAGGPSGGSGDPVGTDGAALSGRASSLPLADSDRKITPGDLLLISIVGESGMHADHAVSATGFIQFPFLGLVEVAGRTPVELKSELEAKLAQEYFRNPEVIVTVREYGPQFVRVLGAVNRPGLYPVGGAREMDILDAIAAAGGVRLDAKSEVVYVHEGERRTISMKELEDPERRIWVEPGDIINVPQSAW